MWGGFCERVADAIEQQRIAAVEPRARAFGFKETYVLRPDLLVEQSPGRARLRLFEECKLEVLALVYEKERIVLNDDQARFFDEMRNTMLIKFYGSLAAVMADEAYLRSKWGINVVFSAVLVLFPRRLGKTTTQCLVSTVVLCSQIGGNVLAYNYTAPQGAQWMSQCRQYMEYMRGHRRFGWTLVKERADRKLVLTQNVNNGSRASLSVFGNASDGRKATSLRGTGAAAFLMNLDEAAFFHKEAMKVRRFFSPWVGYVCAPPSIHTPW